MWCFTYSGGYCAPMIPRGGELELAAVRDHRGVREAIVLAGVVDVVVRVQDPADVVALQAVQLELRVEALPLLDVPRHPEPAP